MKRINTLDELKAERKRLQMYGAQLETELKMDFKELKKDLRPIQLFADGAKHDLVSHHNSVAGIAAGHLAGFLAKQVFLRKAGFLSKLIVPAFVQKFTTGFVENNKSRIAAIFEYLAARYTEQKENKKKHEHNGTGTGTDPVSVKS